MFIQRRLSTTVGFEAGTSDSPLGLQVQALEGLLQPINRCLSALQVRKYNRNTGTCARCRSWSRRMAILHDSSSSASPFPSHKSSGHHKHKPRSSFQATGRENLRVMLEGCHGGSVNQFKLLLLNELAHEASLQALLHQQPEDEVMQFAVAATDPAWTEDFSTLSRSYARRVRQRLLWFGSCLHQLDSASMQDD